MATKPQRSPCLHSLRRENSTSTSTKQTPPNNGLRIAPPSSNILTHSQQSNPSPNRPHNKLQRPPTSPSEKNLHHSIPTAPRAKPRTNRRSLPSLAKTQSPELNHLVIFNSCGRGNQLRDGNETMMGHSMCKILVGRGSWTMWPYLACVSRKCGKTYWPRWKKSWWNLIRTQRSRLRDQGWGGIWKVGVGQGGRCTG